ncbi:RSM22 [Candida oxycetoniae]|uniref:RSM22 n=1 Tax=Candida oxycetoniae TaxID=497107 RepID=A0AAI9WZH5_9ASCO|nr:RSM22 [Candida oxycetoniae]KAI3406416.2 RSM22 [Candida oxycetoniae]
MFKRALLLRDKIIPILSRRFFSAPHLSSKPNDGNFEFDFLLEENRSSKDIVKKYISPEQVKKLDESEKFVDRSPFRNPDGSFIKGQNAAEARLDESTLAGRADHSITVLPNRIAKTIQNNILISTVPSKLREKVVDIYKNLQKSHMEQIPSTSLECNAHIAALFLQDYSHMRQVIMELQKRVGESNFKPQRVLDIGFGPATGMVALNEVMGDEWVPKEKSAYIVGRKNNEMKKRAKILLSRQLNENFSDGETLEESTEKEEDSKSRQESAVEEGDSFVGLIDSKRINIRTKLRDTIPVTKKYDLIMVHHSLLFKEYNFQKDIDANLRMVLRLLAPGGHLILVERGNAVGFETIARARQFMIRPERFPLELGKIPRPYIKGSFGKPQRLKKENAIISDEDIEFEKEMLAKLDAEEAQELGKELENELDEKFGKINEEELKFEEENDESNFVAFDNNTPVEEMLYDKVDYHISILAPCPHHRKCPLQLGDPKYYKIPSHKHRLKFCSFSKIVERPEYTRELKKGKKLAVKWEKSALDGIGTLSRAELQKLGGSGRPGGKNTEDGSYSYLIAQRSLNDVESISRIENLREYSNDDNSPINQNDINNWPRIISQPDKLKKNVSLTVCTGEGNHEKWQIPKSFGKQAYHDARKAQLGDLWALGRKTAIKKQSLSKEAKSNLDTLYKTQKKTFVKEQKRKVWKKKSGVSENEFDDGFLATEMMATMLERSKKYRSVGKKMDVDPDSYEGK